MTVNGDVVIAQMMAINRYLAKMAGLYGDDYIQRAMIDMVVDHVLDMFNGEEDNQPFLA